MLNDELCVVGGGGLKTAERFDPRTQTWSPLPEMHHTRQGPAVVAFEGRLYVAGGNGEGLQSIEYFDPRNNTWTLLPAEML